MVKSSRQIMKISRVASRYSSIHLRKFGVGYSEYESLHFIRHNPGANQEELRDWLNIDKAAVARLVANLERKGYVHRTMDETDRRAKCLYLNEGLDQVVHSSTVTAENHFYSWLMEDIPKEDLEVFDRVLSQMYNKSKSAGKCNFQNVPEVESVLFDDDEESFSTTLLKQEERSPTR